MECMSQVTTTKEAVMYLTQLKQRNITELNEIARELKIEGAANLRKQELIFAILQAQTEKNGVIYGEGVLETLPDGFGFLRAPEDRKSTRLNSSHSSISYAVFCLKKKKTGNRENPTKSNIPYKQDYNMGLLRDRLSAS